MRPVIITLIVVQSVTIFNDFVSPLYYLWRRSRNWTTFCLLS